MSSAISGSVEAAPPRTVHDCRLVTEAKVFELDELTCALWVAVDAATDKLADHAIEAASLRATARTISNGIGDLLSDIRQMKAGGVGWHIPHRDEQAGTDDASGEVRS